MRGVATLLLFVAIATITNTSLAPDEELARNLENVLYKDTFAIAVSINKSRRKLTSNVETFLAAEFFKSRTKFILMMDHKLKRVIVETVENSHQRREHLTVDRLDISNPIKSLVLVVHQMPPARIEVYVDCLKQGEIAMIKPFRNLTDENDFEPLEAFRGKKYHAKVFGPLSIADALRTGNCHNIPYEIDSFHAHQHNSTLPKLRVRRRGDIPMDIPFVDPNGCYNDETNAKTLNLLIDAIKKMWLKLEANLEISEQIRDMLSNCAACYEPPAPPVPKCSHTTCFPNVRCRDTSSGPECGSCPAGFTGNGRDCIRVMTCRDSPCSPYSACEDTRAGYVCGPCPEGYHGDGKRCERLNRCDPNPCFANVRCRSQMVPPYYRCDSCPSGYRGNGVQCVPENECEMVRPCWENVRCTKLHPIGYRCDPCPRGFSGNSSEGVGVEYAREHRQHCQRLDPCSHNNGGCDVRQDCYNSEVTCP